MGDVTRGPSETLGRVCPQRRTQAKRRRSSSKTDHGHYAPKDALQEKLPQANCDTHTPTPSAPGRAFTHSISPEATACTSLRVSLSPSTIASVISAGLVTLRPRTCSNTASSGEN